MLSCEELSKLHVQGLNNYSKYYRNHNIAECIVIFQRIPCFFLIKGKFFTTYSQTRGSVVIQRCPNLREDSLFATVPSKNHPNLFEKRNAKLPFSLKFPYSLLFSNNPLKRLTFEEQNGKHDSQPQSSTCRGGHIKISYSMTWMTMSL